MNVDVELIRRILRAVESESPGQLIRQLDVGCDDAHLLAEHVRMMIDDGLLEGQASVRRDQGSDFVLQGMTKKGRELLGAMRNDTIWRKLGDKAAELGERLTIGDISDFACQ